MSDVYHHQSWDSDRQRVDLLKIANALYDLEEAVGGIETALVWPFHKAPDVLQKLSHNGGDEDWIAYFHKDAFGSHYGWCERPNFGCYPAEEHRWFNGDVVRIGCHA